MTPDIDDVELDVLYVSHERFRMSPQVGTPCRMTWTQIARWLSSPSIDETKDSAGAWSPASYRDNVRRKASLIRIGAIVLDFDESGVDDVADSLGRYAAIVHETFNSTNDAPRSRAVIRLSTPIEAAEYEMLHGIARARMRAIGLPADEGAKDASRVSYLPVRRAGAGYRFRLIEGEALDAGAVIAAQPKPAPRPPPPPPPSPEHRDRYLQAALRRAADAVGGASDGIRHHTLCREAFALARLGLDDGEIERALLPAFVAAAGERREYEGRRTIRDAIRARKGAA
jgi:hypothetical protein